MSSVQLHAQHFNRLFVEADTDKKVLKVKQEIIYYNQTTDTLKTIVLNDWNNAYSAKDTPLAKRFSDEYVRAFHLAKEDERGNTTIHSITDKYSVSLSWQRPEGHPDLVELHLNSVLYPGEQFKITLSYHVKIPSDRFTKFGYDDKAGILNLKDWYLTPARYDNHTFVRYSNENLDDIANAVSDYYLTLSLPKNVSIATDLKEYSKYDKKGLWVYELEGTNRMGFNLVVENYNSFESYKTENGEVLCNLRDNRLTEVQKGQLINQIADFTKNSLGAYPYGKIMVTQADYDRNPTYGVNQLPAFISPYPDSFIYEMKFLKTYLNAYLKNTLKLDPRKDNWLYDGIQIELMMKYIELHHPDRMMMGKLSGWGILKGHKIFKLSFNEQYSYVYLLTARKNLDQPIGDPKDTFIKFNEQIAGKYRAGLSVNYLDDYLGENIVPKTISDFYEFNVNNSQTERKDFQEILNSKTTKNTDWFFTTVVSTRDIIDYKFSKVKEEKDSLTVTIKNRTGTEVPVSLYGLKNGNVVFKQWLDEIKTDSTFTVARMDADRLALNFNNEMPEYNRRNNWRRLDKFFPNNKPLKFTFFQDIEDPYYNQVFYVPSFSFNIYDGFSPGFRIHNKSLLDKPFIFDLEPTYSIKTGQLIGSFSMLVNQYIRSQSLYSIRYAVGGSTYHYAPDARYIKFNPSVVFRLREDDYRQNKKQSILVRQVLVDRESSSYVATDEQNENYSVFNLRYSRFESEITRHYNFFTDLQLSGSFGKVSGEIQYRRLFNDNRRINLRLYAGTFIYRNTTSEFFSFGLDRPTDYMFDYSFYGRSETTGLFSQQYVMAEGGFKSKLDTRYANQWMTTANASFNIWNWIEVYGDAGFIKNHYSNAEFVYDSGIRLNLLPDYFELYFPVYSSNGFEPSLGNYSERIRFVVTISPGTLVGLFTRKWL
jgi:hypothetical protein